MMHLTIGEVQQFARTHNLMIVSNELINGIRTEIEQEAELYDANINADIAAGLNMAVDIIDKHMCWEGREK